MVEMAEMMLSADESVFGDIGGALLLLRLGSAVLWKHTEPSVGWPAELP